MQRKIILFKLNEVPLRILEEYCQWHPESTLSRRRREFTQFETYSEDIGHLSPWKTWPSVHRGVNDGRHFIADFGQDLSEVDAEFPPIWKLLASAGVKTAVCGSLHTYPMPDDLQNYAFYVPDTFAAGSECFPENLSLYQQFNLTMARESARNVAMKLPWMSALKLLRHSSQLGFKLSTFADVGSHLASERLTSWKKSRRRTYQAVLAFDVFMKQLTNTLPDFATFFTNHVAATMHRFWAAAFPADYESFGYDDRWVHTYSHEIEFAMGKFDAFLARLLAFIDRNREYDLWITTSMGQAATEALPLETQLYITDIKRFTTMLGLADSEWNKRPSMLPQFNFFIEPHKQEHFRRQLDSLTVAGQPVGYREATSGFFSVDFGHANLQGATAQLGERTLSLAELGLANVEIEDKSGCSAYHIPQGALLIYDPNDRTAKKPSGQISTLDLAPALLNNFGLPVPSYMRRPRSLTPA